MTVACIRTYGRCTMAYDEQKNGGLAAIGFSQSRLLKGSLASSLASAQALGRRCRSIPFSFEN